LSKIKRLIERDNSKYYVFNFKIVFL
jgi:hypothetical protein